MGENQQPQKKFLRFDEESHLLLIKDFGSSQKLETIYVEDIKEVWVLMILILYDDL